MRATAYLPAIYPHRWLPAKAELTSWEQIEPWYRQILGRPVRYPEELEAWLYDVDELNAAVSQEGGRRYIAMTCQTDDPAREAAYLRPTAARLPVPLLFHRVRNRPTRGLARLAACAGGP